MKYNITGVTEQGEKIGLKIRAESHDEALHKALDVYNFTSIDSVEEDERFKAKNVYLENNPNPIKRGTSSRSRKYRSIMSNAIFR